MKLEASTMDLRKKMQEIFPVVFGIALPLCGRGFKSC